MIQCQRDAAALTGKPVNSQFASHPQLITGKKIARQLVWTNFIQVSRHLPDAWIGIFVARSYPTRKPMKRQKLYVVISHDADQQQLFFDVVPATCSQAAGMRLADLREYAAVSDAMSIESFARLTLALVSTTTKRAESRLRKLARAAARDAEAPPC